MKTTFLILLFLIGNTYGQNCPVGSSLISFTPLKEVQIIACIQDEVGIGKQSVFWGAKNLTKDRLQIRFIKVVYTKCGNIIRGDANTYLNPGEFIGGTTFSGEITFETQVWKEDCNVPKYRIQKVSYENLTIKNISQEEREKTVVKEAEIKKESKMFADEKKQIVTTSQYNSYAQQNVDSYNSSKMLAARDYANRSVGLNAQQIQASKEIAQNTGDFVAALMKIGDSKRKADYDRAERRNESKRKDADNGDVEAMHDLYVSYRFGKAKDYYKAKYWLNKAVEANDCESISEIATNYYIGDKDLGYEKNDLKRFEWSNKLFLVAKEKFENGDLAALKYVWKSTNDIANCYRYGKGIEKNDEKYLEWLSTSVDYKSVEAAVDLSNYYNFGINKDRDKYLAALNRVIPIIEELEKNVPDLYTSKDSYKLSSHISIYENMGEAYSGIWFKEAGNTDCELAKMYFEKAILITNAIYSKSKYSKRNVKNLEKKIKLCYKGLKK